MRTYSIMIWNGVGYEPLTAKATHYKRENDAVKFYQGEMDSDCFLEVQDGYWNSIKIVRTAKGESPFCLADNIEAALAQPQV